MTNEKKYSSVQHTQPSHSPEAHQDRRVHTARSSRNRHPLPSLSILSSTTSTESTESIRYGPSSPSQKQSFSPLSSFSTQLLKLRSSKTEPFKRRLPKFDLLSLNDLSLRRRRPSEPTLRSAHPPLPQLSSQNLLAETILPLPSVQSWSTLTSPVDAIHVNDDDYDNDEAESWQTVKQVCARVRQLCGSEDTMTWSRLSVLLETLEHVGACAGASAPSGGVLSANKDTLNKLRGHCEQETEMTQVILAMDALVESWLIEYNLTQCLLVLDDTLPSNTFCMEAPQFIIQQQQQLGKNQGKALRMLPDYSSIWPDHLDPNISWFRTYFIGKPYVTFVRFKKPTTIISVVHHDDNAVYRIIIRTHGMSTRYHCVREDQMMTMSESDGHHHAVAIACSSRLNLREFKYFSAESTILSGTEKELLRFDEMAAPKHYKFGVIHVQSGQDTEEQWFANSGLTAGLERLLDVVGERIELKGYMGYGGGLDTRAGESGEVSYVSKWRDHEIMFHVGPLMPLRKHDQQQVHRKRYIGNDIVCLVFVDNHGKFDPSMIRSKLLHVFIVVQQVGDGDHWRVEVVRSVSVRAFRPTVPSPSQLSSVDLRDFLLLKMVNAENAALKSDKFAIPTDKARDALLANTALDLAKHDMPSPPSTPTASPSKSETSRSSGGTVAVGAAFLRRSSLENVPIPPISSTTRSTMFRDIKDGLVRHRRRSDGIKSPTITSQFQRQQQLSTAPEIPLPSPVITRSKSFSIRLGRRASIKRTDIAL